MTNIYRMRLDLNVLNHLGLNLYSNVAAVLSEAVANAWDADAPEVRIQIQSDKDSIIISDNGSGMTVAQANERFLNVGYSKREEEGSTSPQGRSLMGRKGIGKLSLFSIANRISIVSSRDGEHHGFVMSVPDLESAISGHEEYFPTPIPAEQLPPAAKGTQIYLSNLRRRATTQTVNALRKRIARRFSVIGKDFKVFLNGIEITVADRDDLAKAQFLWEFAGASLAAADTDHIVRRGTLGALVDVGSRSYPVTGWIGSARLPKLLETDDSGNLNSIVVLAHGRLIQENILDRVNMGGIFTKYLTGQIDADFLDLDGEADIATSDRQRVIEDDARYQGLLAFVRIALNQIEGQWGDWRAELGAKEVVELYPRIAGWIESLPLSSRPQAKRVIGVIQGLSIDDEEKRRQLLRHGLMAFERLRLTESSAKLADAIAAEAEDLLPLIGDQDQLEASLYLDIIRSRLAVITQFTRLVDANAKEKVLQELLFDHLWLLDASWERAAGSERMEQNVHKEFEKIDAGLTAEEKAGRIDIKYRTMAGKHVIIELKRYSVQPLVYELAQQGKKYLDATKKLLTVLGREGEAVEIIFVVGTGPKDSTLAEATDLLAPMPGRIRTYEQLIQGAINAYQEYLEKRKSVDAIENLLRPMTLDEGSALS